MQDVCGERCLFVDSKHDLQGAIKQGRTNPIMSTRVSAACESPDLLDQPVIKLAIKSAGKKGLYLVTAV